MELGSPTKNIDPLCHMHIQTYSTCYSQVGTLVATDQTQCCLDSVTVQETVFQPDLGLSGILQYFRYHNYFLNVWIKEIHITFDMNSIYSISVLPSFQEYVV